MRTDAVQAQINISPAADHSLRGDLYCPEEVAVPRTKIVCTIGPATNGRDEMRALMQAGMDLARIKRWRRRKGV